MRSLVKLYLGKHAVCNSPNDSYTDIRSRLTSLDLLEERRTRMRVELNQLLVTGKNGVCSCGWAKTRSDKYEQLLLDYEPLKMFDVPLSEIIEKMEKVSCEDMDTRFHPPENWGGYYHKVPTYGETLPAKLETLKKKASICLDCVQSIDVARSCRFQHE